MGDDYITRRQIRIPEIRIHREEVTAIREIDTGLLIFTADKFRSLFIPVEVEGHGYEEVKAALSAWTPVQLKSSVTRAKNAALFILVLAGFGIILFSSSPWLVLVVGLVMAGCYTYSYWILRRSKGVDPRFKRKRDFIIVLVFLVFIISFKLCVFFGGLELFIDGLLRWAEGSQ